MRVGDFIHHDIRLRRQRCALVGCVLRTDGEFELVLGEREVFGEELLWETCGIVVIGRAFFSSPVLLSSVKNCESVVSSSSV